jgi:hypothetical protein
MQPGIPMKRAGPVPAAVPVGRATAAVGEVGKEGAGAAQGLGKAPGMGRHRADGIMHRCRTVTCVLRMGRGDATVSRFDITRILLTRRSKTQGARCLGWRDPPFLLRFLRKRVGAHTWTRSKVQSREAQLILLTAHAAS